MCGIVGYSGYREALPILLEGLQQLEYRGYDSAGVAVNSEGVSQVVKCKGRIAALEALLETHPLSGHSGIGHTRWATHGKPEDRNAHPHVVGKIALVHNGIIENYAQIKENLLEEGCVFVSDTDTEVLVHLIERGYRQSQNLHQALRNAMQQVTGSLAVAVTAGTDEIVVARRESPLIIGKGEKESFIASDIPALLPFTQSVYLLQDGEIAIIRGEEIHIMNERDEEIHPKLQKIIWEKECARKGAYESFMLKEIGEDAQSVRATLRYYAEHYDAKPWVGFQQIAIIGCGTAYNVGCAVRLYMEKVTGLPVVVLSASEYRYFPVHLAFKTLVIAVSQSGETADTLGAVRVAKANGCSILALTNVPTSSLTRCADWVYPTLAGPEIAVASTKAYNAQYTALLLLGAMIADDRAQFCIWIREIERAANEIERIFAQKESIAEIAKAAMRYHKVLFLGRGAEYAIAMEGALKLKEISYIHCEAYSSGELKHGPLAVVDSDTLVIPVMTVERVFAKNKNALEETRARNGTIFAVSCFALDEWHFPLPALAEEVMPLIAIVPLQLFAYYMAKLKGLDADKPRNLAKSVTVE